MRKTSFRKSPKDQGWFEWSLTVNDDAPIPGREIFGRRSLNADTLADILPEKSLFSGVIRMPVITAVAQKGGPGKSTLCHHLLGALGLSGRRVLVIDADPQGTLTKACLGTEAEQIPASETVAAIYAGRDPLPSDIIRPSGIAGVDLIPGSKAADSFNFPDPHLASAETQALMRNFIDEVRGDYAMTWIDTAPNLYALCFGAMAASDYCIVPCIPEKKNVESLSAVLEVIRQVQEGPNPSLVNLGIIVSQIKRLSAHTVIDRRLVKKYGPLIFDTRIPYSKEILEADIALKPVAHFEPKGTSAKVFKSLTDEIVARIVAHENPAAREVVAHV